MNLWANWNIINVNNTLREIKIPGAQKNTVPQDYEPFILFLTN